MSPGSCFAGVFVVVVFGFVFGLAVDVFFVVSGMGMPGIPGIPVCWAGRTELVPELTASTAANAATYLSVIPGVSLMNGVAKLATKIRGQCFLIAGLIERWITPLVEAALNQETGSKGATR